MHAPQNRARHAGFTMLELIVTAGIIAVDDDAGVAGTGAWARRSGGTAGAVGGVRLVGAGAILEVHPMAGVVCALDPCVRICCTVDK